MPRSRPARVSAKVQPKLRMIANGSDEVNALRAALDAVLAGERPERAETEARGCSVKWRA